MLKKLLFSAAVIFSLSIPAKAWIWEQAPDKAVTVRYRLAVAANISTSTIVIDLSDTTNWPHKDTGAIHVKSIRMEIDKAAASTCTVRLGVVNFVDSSTGSVTWFLGRQFETNVSNTDPTFVMNYSPQFLNLKSVSTTPAVDGSTPYILSSEETSGSTTYQTDVNLPNPAAAANSPGLGDVVMDVVNGAGAITILLQIVYNSTR